MSAERFWERVDKSGDCWTWTAGKTSAGYGVLYVAKKQHLAHRYVFQLTGQEIPAGMFVDHLCFTRACVRPDHLRTVTNKQNMEHQSGAQANNKSSGIRGVTWDKRTQSWKSQAKHNGRMRYGGYHSSIEEAAEAARQLRLSLFTHNDADRKTNAV